MDVVDRSRRFLVAANPNVGLCRKRVHLSDDECAMPLKKPSKRSREQVPVRLKRLDDPLDVVLDVVEVERDANVRVA